jgi:selenoprotein W-related protein
LTDDILSEREIEAYIKSWTLVPATGGVFEVTVNGNLIFSKKALGRHAEPGEVRRLIVEKLEIIKSQIASTD